jgi:rare lipoprotein A
MIKQILPIFLLAIISFSFNKVDTQEGASKDSLITVVFNDVNYKVVGKVKKGKASFYSLKFEGRKTATGSTFSHKNYTAASNTFPLGTYVLVTNPKNKQFVVVRINDRMSKSMSKKGRIVDLTRLAAKDLGILKLGIGSVLVQKVQKEPNK